LGSGSNLTLRWPALLQNYQLPMGLIFFQDGAKELTVYPNKGCLSSVFWPLSGGDDECNRLLGAAKAKFRAPSPAYC